MKIEIIAKSINVSAVDRVECLSSEDLLRVELDIHEKREVAKDLIVKLIKLFPKEFTESIEDIYG